MSVLRVLLAVLAAVVPTSVYVLFVWWLDRYEKEPLRLLLAAFVWGAVPAVALAATVEVALQVPLDELFPRYGALLGISIVGPVIEEGLKAIALVAISILARYEFDGLLDGVIYGSLVGFGFAMTENLLYFIGSDGATGEWLALILGRSVVFGLNHAMFASFTGVGLSLATGTRDRTQAVGIALLGIALATGAHQVHNTFVSMGELCLIGVIVDWSGVAVIGAVILLAWRREQLWLKRYLEEEVSAGVLSDEQYAIIRSWHARVLDQVRALAAGDVSGQRRRHDFFQAATELAFKKHQASLWRYSGAASRVEELRKTVQRLGMDLSAGS